MTARESMRDFTKRKVAEAVADGRLENAMARQPPGRIRVTLRIVLEYEGAFPSSGHLSAMHERAEGFAARVIVCGDKRGVMHIQEDASERLTPLAAVAERVTMMPGGCDVRRLGAAPKRKRKR